ncbi:MAG TPA: metallopeptidase TldD-related protein [Thermoanaerobaculia bacterium]|nr:metallopeptidase TldD-related protein [Thermoanaerobaculia bacterium]
MSGTLDDPEAIFTRALSAAAADEADAVLIVSDQNITRFANSAIHQNMSEISAELTLRVFAGGAMGVASTTSFGDDDIAHAASVAREAARHSVPIPGFAGLYKGGDDVSAAATFDAAVGGLPPAEKARSLRAVFDRGRELGIHFAGSYGNAATTVVCGNTHGVRRECRFTAAEATLIAIRGEESGYATAIDRHPIDVVALGEEAIGKATLHAGTHERIDGGAFDVILEPPAIAEVLEWMNMIAFSGQAYEDGSSFFAGNIGTQMLGSNFTLADDAVDPAFLPFPFDLEGLPKRRVELIERGIIRTPVVDKTWADRLHIAPTANAWALGSSEHGAALHLSVGAGDETREAMVRSTRRGIWVTRFNYVNGLLEPKTALMTGTTRDGTFLIRDGEVVARLPNLRWTQSMVDAFSNIRSLTPDRRRVGAWFNPFGGTLAPAMKIEGWQFDTANGQKVARS